MVGTNYIGLEHIPRRSFGFQSIGKIDKELSLKIKFEEGDILFGKIRPYFHKVAPAPVSGVTSSDSIVIRPQNEHYGLVLMTVSSDNFVAHSVQSSNGTKMPRANWDVLKKYKVPKINSGEEVEFNNQIVSIVKLIRNITLRNEKLANTRDLLLPRLMSGEIEL
jgi:type I restriction enzyme S subunit